MTTFNIGDKNIIFKYVSIYLKETYKSDFKVTDEYSIELGKCIYMFLRDLYPQLSILATNSDSSVEEEILADDISNIYLNSAKIYQNIEELNSTEKLTLQDKLNLNSHPSTAIYNTNVTAIPESIDLINKYNIDSWPIDDTILQFLYPETIISELSDIDEIAEIQILCSKAVGYEPENLGRIDNNFKLLCYNVQKNNLLPANINTKCTGYFDIYVESFMRSLNEVR